MVSTFLSAIIAAATGVAFTLFGTLVTGAEEVAVDVVEAAGAAAVATASAFGASPAGLAAVSSISAKISPIKILSPSVAL